MKTLYIILVICVLSTFIAIFSLNRAGGASSVIPEFNQEYLTQSINSHERNIQDKSYSKAGEIQLIDFNIYNPVKIKAYDDDTVYILDHQTKKISKINVVKAELLNVYGNGFGSGPGEGRIITDFDVSENGDVYLVDPSQSKISKFSKSGDYLQDLKPRIIPYRVAAYENILVLGQRVPNRHMFALFPIGEQRAYEEFGELLNNHQYTSMAIDGTIGKHQDGFVYISVYSSYLLHFDLYGKLVYNVNMVDGIELPIVQSGGGSNMSVNSAMLYRKVKIQSEEIYVYTAINEDNGFNRYMDIYDLSTGRYKNSFLLENAITEVEMHGERLYYITVDGNLSIYEISF